MGLAKVKDADDPRPELLQLRDYWGSPYGDWLWLVVIQGIKPGNWASMRLRMLKQGRLPADADRAVREAVAAHLAVARELSGREDLGTPEEWDAWYRATHPELIPRARWLGRLLAHPELISFGRSDEAITPKHPLSSELAQGYCKLARAAPPGARWRVGLTLLLYCDRTDEAPLLIDDIEQQLLEHSHRFAERNTWPIRILSYRFGVNHFWDVGAWRRWWAEYEGTEATHSAGAAGPVDGQG
jgi:hypothetical protein